MIDMLKTNRAECDFGHWRLAASVGLVASFLLPPLAAIAQEAPTSSGALRRAIVAFPNMCARCHKADGRGGPAYGGYAADLRKTMLTHEELVAVITDGRRDRGMPTFKGVMSKRKIDAITTFIEKNFKGKPVVEK